MKQNYLKRTFLFKTFLLLCALIAGSGTMWGAATTIASWGKVSFPASTAVKASAGDTNNKDVATITSSKAMTSSGTGNAYYGGSAGGAMITIANLNLSNYTGITLTFYGRASQSGNFAVSTSTNGSTWTSLTTVSLNGTESQKTVSSIPSTAQYIKLVHSKSSGSLYFGTVVISGTVAGPATPTFSPAAGAVEKGQEITMSCATDGATIYYTTNGDAPTSSSTAYSALSKPTITSATTIKAIAVKDEKSSSVATASYTIKQVATPTFSPAAGAVVYGAAISLSCETEGATIYYTTDGSDPTTSSTEYDSEDKPTITTATTIKAIAVKTNWDDSEVGSAAYTTKIPDAPTFGTTSGTSVYYGTKVTLSADAGTNIYYTMTTNGDTPADPTNASTAYPDGGIAINNNTVKIKAIAYDAGGNASSVSSANYSLKNPDAPTFSPAAGAVAEGSAVTLSAVEGTTIHYTTNGDDPTSVSTTYDSENKPVVNAAQTIKAIAIDGAGNSSTTASAAYTTFKANISLSAAQSLTFINFSGIGSYSYSKSADFPASDDNSYRMTGDQFGYYSSSLQMQKSNGVLTSGTISTPNGFVLAITAATQPIVQFGGVTTAASSSADGTSYYSCASTSSSFTLTANATVNITAITITANKGVNTITATTARTIDRTNSESTITLDATSSSGSVTYAVKSSTIENEDYSFNTSTGVLTVTGTYSGSIIITASSAETSSYLAAEDVDITVTIVGSKVDPTIAVSDDNVTYGEDYELDISGFASGAVSLVSGNTSIATVDGLTITPVAVGTVTITVNTASSAMYNSGSATFALTVDAPAGKSKTIKSVSTSTATLDFTDNSEWGFPSNTDKGVDANDYNDGTYTITLTGTTGNGYGFNSSDKYLILGKEDASLTFQEFDKFVTQIDVTGRSGASGSVTQNIYVGSTAVSEETTGATGENEYEINSNYQDPGTIYTLKVTNGNNTQITEIVLHFTEVRTENVTLNANGYATYCSLYPVDFSKATGYTAWQITAIDESSITFGKITGKIKGGQGVLLKGTAGDEITLYTTTSSTTLGDNKFFGTTAPTVISAGTYLGLSGKTFVPVNAGTVPVGKALIPVSELPAGARDLKFIFEDDETTGISTIANSKELNANGIYDLQGRKVMNPVKGGLYIVNGRKMVVK